MENIYNKYNIDRNRLKRDYIANPLKKIHINTPTGFQMENPYKEDLEYLYIELNLPQKVLWNYFKITRRIMQRILREYNIKKDRKKVYELSQQTNIERYDAPTPLLSKNIKNKIARIKEQRYAHKAFNNRDKSESTCLSKYNVKNISQCHYTSEIREILFDKDKFAQYINDNNFSNATEMSFHLGVSEATILRYIKHYNIEPHFDYCSSNPEKEIRKYINQYYETINNSRKIVPPYELDIFIPSLNSAVEFNGSYWHSSELAQFNDKMKKQYCEDKGIKLLIIQENEWNKNKSKVFDKLNELLMIKPI